VLEDASVQGLGAAEWAAAAVDAFRRHGADRMVAEVNMGGDLVQAVIRQIDPFLPFKAVRASKGKSVRAEPIAALYEQGRVAHVPGLARLEAQMAQMTLGGFVGAGSPDRVDALVWALTELIVDPSQAFVAPRLRTLG
jgi:phage terminase large subunit-like protein